ncbi:BlaI/MecI/CopY family transcriptional regulator [Dactylosporangium sp. NPDC005555]|uniref:BlaI/MecI/CopY family transcriptional regulator n=1 Tax=Dactylosporangium sp. NPDC005555 TaxID=3154889 RepID=UPI0033B4A986
MPAEDQHSGRRRPGELEAAILRVLVGADRPLTSREVLDRFPDGPGLAYSTIVTILTRMYEKEMVARYREGRSFRYAPLTDGASLTAGRMTALLDTEHDHATVLRRFVNGLRPGDEELLRRLLRDSGPD